MQETGSQPGGASRPASRSGHLAGGSCPRPWSSEPRLCLGALTPGLPEGGRQHWAEKWGFSPSPPSAAEIKGPAPCHSPPRAQQLPAGAATSRVTPSRTSEAFLESAFRLLVFTGSPQPRLPQVGAPQKPGPGPEARGPVGLAGEGEGRDGACWAGQLQAGVGVAAEDPQGLLSARCFLNFPHPIGFGHSDSLVPWAAGGPGLRAASLTQERPCGAHVCGQAPGLPGAARDSCGHQALRPGAERGPCCCGSASVTVR